MFFLTRAVLYLPMLFLTYIGKPFKFDAESNLRHISERELIIQFTDKKREHYFERVFLTLGAVLICFVIAFLTWLSGGAVLIIIPIGIAILLSVDAVLVVARMAFFQEEQKIASARNEIVPLDLWKDTSLNALLAKRNADVEKFFENHPEMRERQSSKGRIYG